MKNLKKRKGGGMAENENEELVRENRKKTERESKMRKAEHEMQAGSVDCSIALMISSLSLWLAHNNFLLQRCWKK